MKSGLPELELKAGDGGVSVRRARFRFRIPCPSSMLISEAGRGEAPHQRLPDLYQFCASRKKSIRTGSLYEDWHFSWETGLSCTEFVRSPGIVDFLAFCKFQKLLILNDLPCGKSDRLPPPPPTLSRLNLIRRTLLSPIRWHSSLPVQTSN